MPAALFVFVLGYRFCVDTIFLILLTVKSLPSQAVRHSSSASVRLYKKDYIRVSVQWTGRSHTLDLSRSHCIYVAHVCMILKSQYDYKYVINCMDWDANTVSYACAVLGAYPLTSPLLYYRDEQTPLLALRPQLQANPPPPPGAIGSWELQTGWVSLETRPGQLPLLPRSDWIVLLRLIVVIVTFLLLCLS